MILKGLFKYLSLAAIIAVLPFQLLADAGVNTPYTGTFHPTTTGSVLLTLTDGTTTYDFAGLTVSGSTVNNVGLDVNLTNDFTKFTPQPSAIVLGIANLYRSVCGGGTVYFNASATSGSRTVYNANQAPIGTFTISVVSSVAQGNSTKYTYSLIWNPAPPTP